MQSRLAFGLLLVALAIGALALPASSKEKASTANTVDGALFPAVGSDLTSIRYQATVPIDAASAFAKWSSVDGIKSWLGIDAKIELRIGGAYEWYFLPASAPERGGEGCQILSYLPNRMLSFSWNAPPKFPEERKLRSWVVVRFEEVDDASTRVTLTHTGFGSDGKWADVKAYFSAAWPSVLGAFQRSVTK